MLPMKLHEVAGLGQSIWLDDLRRALLASGELERYVQMGVRGVTSNPAIFEKAMRDNAAYHDDLQRLARQGKSAQEIYETLAVADIRLAADILRPVYEATAPPFDVLQRGDDGYVSLEVNPDLAHDADATIAEAQRLVTAVARPNVMIKVPATVEGMEAIERLTVEGINVNATLLFSLVQYDQVADAFLTGLETRAERGEDISMVASVASFFVSRVDSKVDPMLDAIGTPDALKLRGKIGLANAKNAYQRFKLAFQGERWEWLTARDARPQRVLFGSTSAKNPNYPDIMYVDDLIGPQTVNTVPQETLEAFLERGTVALTLERNLTVMRAQLITLEALGIDLDAVCRDLLDEGLQKFAQPFESMLGAIEQMRKAFIPA